MAIWTVFSRNLAGDTAAKAADRVVFVRDAFSWLTLFFTPLALLYHRLWLAFGAYVLLSVVLNMAGAFDLLPEPAVSVIMIGIQILFAFELPTLRAAKLQRLGFEEQGVVVAGRRDEAERRFFALWAGLGPIHPAARPTVRPAPAGLDTRTGVIGSFSA